MTGPHVNSAMVRSVGVDTAGVFLLFVALSATSTPDVNEAHYLAKARHYWDPAWCAGDLFLESRDAHTVFYWSFGWVAALLPLSAAAWIGRVVTWLLLAWSWTRLSRSVVPGRYWALLTAAVFATLLQWGHMAGEWILGGVEAKGFAFVLLFLALEALVENNWRRVWVLLGAASSFHVLVGGWSTLAAAFAWLATPRGERTSLKSMALALAGGGLLALPGLVPALSLNADASEATQRAAALVYTWQRLPHHLVFHQLSPVFVIRHLSLIGVVGMCAWMLRDQQRVFPLGRFLGGSLLIALVGVVLDQALRRDPALASSWLRFYWFRLSDVMVPVTAALLLVSAVQNSLPSRSSATLLRLILVLVAAANLAFTAWTHWSSPLPPALLQSMPREVPRVARRRFIDWQKACRWIDEHLPPGERVLTPRHQQGFKWYAQRAEVVNWKDIPQDARAILRWHEALEELYPSAISWRGIGAHSERRLVELAEEYGFRFLLVDRTRSRPLDLPRVFPVDDEKLIYQIYQLPES